MLLITSHSASARRSLRNVYRHHEETIVDRYGGAALCLPTQLGLFLGLRLQEKHYTDVKIQTVSPVERTYIIPESIREAAIEFENRSHPATPYTKFAVGTEHPSPETMRNRRLKRKPRRISGSAGRQQRVI